MRDDALVSKRRIDGFKWGMMTFRVAHGASGVISFA